MKNFSREDFWEKKNGKKTKIIDSISFLMGFAQAFFIYVMSSYLKLQSGMENVGLFYLISYFATLLIFFNLYKIVKKTGPVGVFRFALFLKTLVVFFLIFSPSGWPSIALVIFYIIFGNLEWVSLDEILEFYSSDKMTGRIRGKFLTIMNAGILLGPFLSTQILEKFNFRGIFLFLLLFNVLIAFFAVWKIKKIKGGFKKKRTVREVFEKAIRRKNICRIFYVSFILEFFYALMIMYTPIYLTDLGLSWNQIGNIFTIMLLPFVFIQYPIGLAADKRYGEKEFLLGALILTAFFTLIIYFISSKDIFLWSVVLFATRIGAALIEILRDSYFYKKIDGTDFDLINLFRTARPAAYIIASVFSSILLFFFSLKAVFILISLAVLTAVIPAYFLADNKGEAELKKNF